MSNEITGTNGFVPDESHATATLENFLSKEYDFLIIGGGTAGLTLAVRLTENPIVRVGVLEAGKEKLNDMTIDTPAAALSMCGNPEYDWYFKTVPQKGNRSNIHGVPRGKVLGGSSAINFSMYVRGSDSDYDTWAELVDDSSWSSKEFKQYMRKHQTLDHIDEDMINHSTMPLNKANHGTDGPIHTGFNTWGLPIEDDFIKALNDLTGFDKPPKDPWSGDHIGFYNTLGFVHRTGERKGKRSYAATAYFEPNRSRPNLTVLSEAFVTRIALDESTATGVHFLHSGTEQLVQATREVIVSAGTIMSPKILELSGIGNPNVLTAAGVNCKIELPDVGFNYQDHLQSAMSWKLIPGIKTLDQLKDPEALTAAGKEYAERGTGPLSCISSCQGYLPYAHFASKENMDSIIELLRETPPQTDLHKKQLMILREKLQDSKSANVQIYAIPSKMKLEASMEDIAEMFAADYDPSGQGLSAGVCIEYPASRGTCHINSTDPNEHPTIDPGYLTSAADVALLGQTVSYLNRVTQSEHLRNKISERTYPPKNIDLSDPKVAEEAARNWCSGQWHPIGTCAMGAVVDSRLKVYGAKGLRVVDASVFPSHISGNICSTVYAVAEKAADIIKEDHSYDMGFT